MADVKRSDWYAFALYVSLAVAVGFTDHRVRRFAEFVVSTYVPEVVQGTADAPSRYRVLAPFVIDAATRTSTVPPLITFLVLRLLCIYAGLVATHVYLRRWYAPAFALLGTTLLAALLPLTFTNSWAHPDSMVEIVLFTAGCAAVVAKRDGWFLALLMLAALNRETSAFLLLLWAWQRLASERSMSMLRRIAFVGSAWVAVFVGLRWIRGFATYDYWMLPTNLASLIPLPDNFDPYVRVSGYMWLVLTIPLMSFAVVGVRQTGWSSYFGRAVWVAASLLLVGFTISSVIESRIFTPLFPLLLPAAMAGLGVPMSDGVDAPES
jgi:hypothetical protein